MSSDERPGKLFWRAGHFVDATDEKSHEWLSLNHWVVALVAVPNIMVITLWYSREPQNHRGTSMPRMPCTVLKEEKSLDLACKMVTDRQPTDSERAVWPNESNTCHPRWCQQIWSRMTGSGGVGVRFSAPGITRWLLKCLNIEWNENPCNPKRGRWRFMFNWSMFDCAANLLINHYKQWFIQPGSVISTMHQTIWYDLTKTTVNSSECHSLHVWLRSWKCRSQAIHASLKRMLCIENNGHQPGMRDLLLYTSLEESDWKTKMWSW